jgi:hypothetical protein
LIAAQSAAVEKVNLTTYVDENGKTTEYLTTQNVLEKCPEWTLDKEPPLPIQKAVKIAEEHIKVKYPQFTSFKIIHIALSPVYNSKYRNRWYYDISVQAVANLGGVSASSHFNVIVLMDGTIVEPTEVKNGE